ncbi:hypothetical protein [Pseudacidovorax intermedius]|uniref:hypothetical protein n=1 Tax=Pseudacidovorax intermedius TaxID=433924 RepID=UPI00034C538F|nr:hypothetical protein [Pseudacidovorax intermedius]
MTRPRFLALQRLAAGATLAALMAASAQAQAQALPPQAQVTACVALAEGGYSVSYRLAGHDYSTWMAQPPTGVPVMAAPAATAGAAPATVQVEPGVVVSGAPVLVAAPAPVVVASGYAVDPWWVGLTALSVGLVLGGGWHGPHPGPRGPFFMHGPGR